MGRLNVFPFFGDLSKSGQHMLLGNTDMIETSKSIIGRGKPGQSLGA